MTKTIEISHMTIKHLGQRKVSDLRSAEKLQPITNFFFFWMRNGRYLKRKCK